MTLNEVDQRIQALRNGLAVYAPQIFSPMGNPAIQGVPYGLPMTLPGAPGLRDPYGVPVSRGLGTIPPGALPGMGAAYPAGFPNQVPPMGLGIGATLPVGAYPGLGPVGAIPPTAGIPYAAPFFQGLGLPYANTPFTGVPHLAPPSASPFGIRGVSPFAAAANVPGVQIPTVTTPWAGASAPFANPMGAPPVGATHPFGSAGSLASGSEATGMPATPTLAGQGTGYDATSGAALRTPVADLYDDGKELTLVLDVPGVRKEDLELVANDRFLSVRGVARSDRSPSDLVFGERGGSPTYMRTVPLPVEVQSNKVRATFRDGVLSIVLPKRNPTEGARKVEIEGASV